MSTLIRPNVVVPIKAMSASAKLKIANEAALKAGISKLFKTLTPLMTWGFHAANDAGIGKLTAGPGLGTIDFDAQQVEVLPVDVSANQRPLILDVTLPKGHFYVVDVFGASPGTLNFFATSDRTATGANFTTHYGMTVTTAGQHFVFVLQVHGSADGSKDYYRIKIGADAQWQFEKIELTKVE
ncbi:hypothetical protein QTI66_19610 [Variovorax sp. J22R133]|uniref:hypothetical protein n=1 Tax=Variovorax brevis TaxID=3053503 RepID=UPI002577ABDF|nr:hypothetical protein [Variovorax sp. J22R133]MDM0114370.1 hypothetical protein [Variovorax sp. J22R133]